MESSAVPFWKPDTIVIRWAWIVMIFLSLFVGTACALSLLLSSYFIGAIGVVVGLLVTAASMVAFFRAVGRSQSIPPSIRRILRRNLLLFGPIAMAQLLVYNYFPNSGFSGLERVTNERRA